MNELNQAIFEYLNCEFNAASEYSQAELLQEVKADLVPLGYTCNDFNDKSGNTVFVEGEMYYDRTHNGILYTFNDEKLLMEFHNEMEAIAYINQLEYSTLISDWDIYACTEIGYSEVWE